MHFVNVFYSLFVLSCIVAHPIFDSEDAELMARAPKTTTTSKKPSPTPTPAKSNTSSKSPTTRKPAQKSNKNSASKSVTKGSTKAAPKGNTKPATKGNSPKPATKATKNSASKQGAKSRANSVSKTKGNKGPVSKQAKGTNPRNKSAAKASVKKPNSKSVTNANARKATVNPKSAAKSSSLIEQYDPAKDPVAQARKKNSDPNRKITTCKKVSDCNCPKPKDAGKRTTSTSCINGKCSCDNKAINALGNGFVKAVAAIGNAPITKAVNGLMRGLSTAKEVAGLIAGAVLGPEAKEALRFALNAVPDTGESYLDEAGKKLLQKAVGK